jgi:hypothetical protein
LPDPDPVLTLDVIKQFHGIKIVNVKEFVEKVRKE